MTDHETNQLNQSIKLVKETTPTISRAEVIRIIENEPLGYRTADEHQKLESFAERILDKIQRLEVSSRDGSFKQYMFDNIDDFENTVGYRVNSVFKDGWRMARNLKITT